MEDHKNRNQNNHENNRKRNRDEDENETKKKESLMNKTGQEKKVKISHGDSTTSADNNDNNPRKFPQNTCSSLLSCHSGTKFLTNEQKLELVKTCKAITTKYKGILAADESAGTIGKRFAQVGFENTTENRRLYRQGLFESVKDLSTFISAVILDPETVYQKSDYNTGEKGDKAKVTFTKRLIDLGIIPGVKPHLKVYDLPGQNGSTVMQGLDSLASRCKKFYQAGCKFAKWRSPLHIDLSSGQPSEMVINSNMRDLARYALICQSEGLVPIVEPDIILDGNHNLEASLAINIKVHSTLFKECLEHGVYLEGLILKTNMVNPGKDCTIKYTMEEIGEANIIALTRYLPTACHGINYLSGGQNFQEALKKLNAINLAARKKFDGRPPWNISFSWSAAIQLPLLEALESGKKQITADDIERMSDLFGNHMVKHLQEATQGSLDEDSLNIVFGDGLDDDFSISDIDPYIMYDIYKG